MTQVCSKCSHANPPEAIYCYHDGVILGGHSANGGPVQAGSQPFPSQFVFPTGQACRNFDQLAVACQQNWSAAVDLLRQGFLASFLGGIGRADLALAAQEAARFPDQDRGLDQLLEKLPSQVLETPKLRAEPTEINLGILQMGTNHTFEVHLANQGMRLLYGTAVSDCKWLTLGDAPGNQQKLFQFGAEGVINVHVRGQHLRAGNKPLEGHLIVDSNGGAATITVRVEVPAKPYPDGVLAGALTPRQIAEKAHTAPKEAAPLFEAGAVARWFTDNGWIYPVQGPPASGVGAVQQFFEALGLSKAPKVDITQSSLTLTGPVGASVQGVLELKAQEKRPVFAHAVADQPWVDVSRTLLSGRTANVVVLVPHIPDRPGDVLQANVTVTANGNQRFVVPVTLTIEGRARPYYAEVTPVEVVAQPVAALPVIAVPVTPASVPVIPVAVVSPPVAAVPVVAEPVLTTAVTPPPVRTPPGPPPLAQPGVAPPAAAPFVPVPVSAASALMSSPLAPVAVRLALHALPLLALCFFLLVLLARDVFFSDDSIPIDPVPKLSVHFDEEGTVDEFGTQNRGTYRWFGLTEVTKTAGQEARKLTYSKYGKTNDTLIRIGGQSTRLGLPPDWTLVKRPPEKLGEHGGKKVVWQSSSHKIQVTQLVEIVPGEPIEYRPGKLKRYYDTCRIRFIIENKGSEATPVGLRMVVDTLIGTNDGVPFTVPGMRGLVGRDSSKKFETPGSVPDFIQVLENASLKDPGLVAFMSLKLGGNVEAPSQVLLTHWPGLLMQQWDIPEAPIGDDSAVVLFWDDKDLPAGGKREVGFSYGLGSLSVSKGGRLGISVGGALVKDSDLTVVALVGGPESGEKLTLKLPSGLKLISGDAQQTVPPPEASGQSPVTWRVRAERTGTFTIEVQSNKDVSQKKSVTIRAKTIF
jgi:hypothetical protein